MTDESAFHQFHIVLRYPALADNRVTMLQIYFIFLLTGISFDDRVNVLYIISN